MNMISNLKRFLQCLVCFFKFELQWEKLEKTAAKLRWTVDTVARGKQVWKTSRGKYAMGHERETRSKKRVVSHLCIFVRQLHDRNEGQSFKRSSQFSSGGSMGSTNSVGFRVLELLHGEKEKMKYPSISQVLLSNAGTISSGVFKTSSKLPHSYTVYPSTGEVLTIEKQGVSLLLQNCAASFPASVSVRVTFLKKRRQVTFGVAQISEGKSHGSASYEHNERCSSQKAIKRCNKSSAKVHGCHNPKAEHRSTTLKKN